MNREQILAQVAEKGYASLTQGQKDVYNLATPIPAEAKPIIPLTGIESGLGSVQQELDALIKRINTEGITDATGKVLLPPSSGTTATGGLGAIPTGALSTTPTPIQAPTTPQTGAAGVVVAGASATSKSIDDYIKMLTGDTTAQQTEYDDLMKQANEMMGAMGGRGAAQLEAEAAGGVPGIKTALANVNAEILRKTAEYKALQTDIEGKPITMQSIIGSQAQVQKVMASDIGLLQAQALGLQGQLSAAQETANRSVDLKYSDINDALNIRLKQLELLEGQLSKTEQTRSDAVKLFLQDQQNALNVQIANEKDKNATLLNLLQKYPDAQISLTDTVEQANAKIVKNSQIYKKGIAAGKTGEGGVGDGEEKPLSLWEISEFERNYGWTPPYGFTQSQLAQFMNDNPNATPEELEAGAKRALSQAGGEEIKPQTTYVEAVGEIMNTLTEVEMDILYKKAKTEGMTSLWRGKWNDVKAYIESAKEQIEEAIKQGYSAEEIKQYLLS